MKSWDEMSVHERIMTFPGRHPHAFRCMLYLYIERGIAWKAVDVVMRQMGYLPFDIREEFAGFSLGAPTYACPDEDLNSADTLYEGDR